MMSTERRAMHNAGSIVPPLSLVAVLGLCVAGCSGVGNHNVRDTGKIAGIAGYRVGEKGSVSQVRLATGTTYTFYKDVPLLGGNTGGMDPPPATRPLAPAKPPTEQLSVQGPLRTRKGGETTVRAGVTISGRFPSELAAFSGDILSPDFSVGDSLVCALRPEGPYSIEIRDSHGRVFRSPGRVLISLLSPCPPECFDLAFVVPRETVVPDWVLRRLTDGEMAFPGSLFLHPSASARLIEGCPPVFLGEIHSTDGQWHIHEMPAADWAPPQ